MDSYMSCSSHSTALGKVILGRLSLFSPPRVFSLIKLFPKIHFISRIYLLLPSLLQNPVYLKATHRNLRLERLAGDLPPTHLIEESSQQMDSLLFNRPLQL